MLQMMNEVSHAYDCEHYIISEVSDVESPRRVAACAVTRNNDILYNWLARQFQLVRAIEL